MPKEMACRGYLQAIVFPKYGNLMLSASRPELPELPELQEPEQKTSAAVLQEPQELQLPEPEPELLPSSCSRR